MSDQAAPLPLSQLNLKCASETMLQEKVNFALYGPEGAKAGPAPLGGAASFPALGLSSCPRDTSHL